MFVCFYKLFETFTIFYEYAVLYSLPILSFDFYLEEEIDGTTLARLPFDEIRVLLPKLKDRVLFTEKRDTLIKEWSNDASERLDGEGSSNQCSKETFDACSTSQITTSTQDLLDDTPVSSDDMNNDKFETTLSIDSQVNDVEHDDLEEPQQKLPLDFEFGSLPDDIQVIVDENELTKLRGHTNHRRILLNFIFKDVVNNYNLLYAIIKMNFKYLKLTFADFYYRYPTASEYCIITRALLKVLEMPITNENAAVRK